MLKKITIRKIGLTTLTLALFFLLCLIPDSNKDSLELNPKQYIQYVNNEVDKHEIYLLDKDSYVARTKIVLSDHSENIVKKAKELLEVLIISGKGEKTIPNGFRAILPVDVEILNIEIDDNIMIVDFSKELLDINKEYEETMIEAIIYTLTSIDGIEGVKILINGKPLEYLPQNNKKLPELLDRNHGINKDYNITTYNNITATTIYYINKHNNEYYYVPVTKYSNDNREKIKIIIDELSSGPIYESNLMSFLNTNTKLLNHELKDKALSLEFNNYILSDLDDNNILEEVIYSISLSVADAYNIEEVIFYVNKEEVYKSVLKDIE
ncbi:MAG: GerMN domain-containing protein [Bacilli bacterium]